MIGRRPRHLHEASPPRGRAAFTVVLAIGLTFLLLAPTAWPGARDASPRQRVLERIIAGDYAGAIALIETQLKTTPDDPDLLYHAACACSRLGQRDRAAAYLRHAVDSGFREFDRLRQDEDLAAIRDHETYLAIIRSIDNPPKPVDDPPKEPDAHASGPQQPSDALAEWKARYGQEHYRYERDPSRKLAYAMALNEAAQADMRHMLAVEADQLTATLFPEGLGAEILVAIPTARDADELLNDPRIGGCFLPTSRRLIARNIGPSLRHEFVHAFHHAQMARLGQHHRLWMQEGLASLYETYAVNPDGSFTFLPNERHNIVRSLAASHRLRGWNALFELPDDRFVDEGQQVYPQVRSIFEFLADHGKLVAWYQAYVAHFSDDDSGRKAFETVFGSPVTEVEKDWRAWMLSRPPLDLEIHAGDAALGIELSPETTTDGVIVQSVLDGSAAQRAKLQPGDVILCVDGHDTRTAMELLASIASRQPGDQVTIRFRRGDQRQLVVAALRPLRPR